MVECLLPKQKVVGSNPITRSTFIQLHTMNLIFERGDRDNPVGHALLYFRADDGTVLATYVTVPPIKFDISKFVPGFLMQGMQGMEFQLGGEIMAAPFPPVVEEVPDHDYLEALAERRADDLIYAGGVVRGDPMRLMAETGEAAQEYGRLYGEAVHVEPARAPSVPVGDADFDRFADMTESERLRELTSLTGRLRDSLHGGGAEPTLESEMRQLVSFLPAKYRPQELIRAVLTPGEAGQRLAGLYIERSYKLFNEEYLDLERIDREIAAIEH